MDKIIEKISMDKYGWVVIRFKDKGELKSQSVTDILLYLLLHKQDPTTY